MTTSRISKELYYLQIARDVAARGTCLRRNFGAVIVNNDAIVATGYTGAPRGTTSSLEAGWCYREENNIPSGQRYELCRSVHAEQNAIIHAGREKCFHATLYLVGIDARTNTICGHEPCLLCTKMIINAGIDTIIVAKTEETYITLDRTDMIQRYEKQFTR